MHDAKILQMIRIEPRMRSTSRTNVMLAAWALGNSWFAGGLCDFPGAGIDVVTFEQLSLIIFCHYTMYKIMCITKPTALLNTLMIQHIPLAPWTKLCKYYTATKKDLTWTR
jgi:hypothetical protein